MKKVFEIAAGSITGNDHRWSGKNNQDAFAYCQDENKIIAVVCDGCSQGKHSEVGAKIGAKIITRNIQDNIKPFFRYTPEEAIEASRVETLHQIRELALGMRMEEDSFSQLVVDYFLFTVIGVVITPKTTVIFSIGDGLYAINGMMFRLGPFPNNEPPYLAYDGLVNSSLGQTNPDLLKFQINESVPTEQVNNILIGTDGVVNLNDSAGLKIPGKDEIVGGMSQFWLDDRYFANWDMIRRKLFLVNKESVQPVWQEQRFLREKGLLPDDTTLVAIRRKKEGGQ